MDVCRERSGPPVAPRWPTALATGDPWSLCPCTRSLSAKPLPRARIPAPENLRAASEYPPPPSSLGRPLLLLSADHVYTLLHALAFPATKLDTFEPDVDVSRSLILGLFSLVTRIARKNNSPCKIICFTDDLWKDAKSGSNSGEKYYSIAY